MPPTTEKHVAKLIQGSRHMGFELGKAVPATGLGREASPHPKGLHQVDDKTRSSRRPF
jgi:hypothetical protein